MSISYVGNGPPTIPIPPLGSLYYDQVDGILYGAVPNKGDWYVIGGGGSGVAVPIIQKAGDGTNVTSAATVTLTATSSVMYAVSLDTGDSRWRKFGAHGCRHTGMDKPD